MFGLGATLFHALSGELPFPRGRGARDSADPEVRFPQLVSEHRPLPSDVPRPLGELIDRALAKRPEDRPSAAELALGLEPLVALLPRKLAFGRGGTRART